MCTFSWKKIHDFSIIFALRGVPLLMNPSSREDYIQSLNYPEIVMGVLNLRFEAIWIGSIFSLYRKIRLKEIQDAALLFTFRGRDVLGVNFLKRVKIPVSLASSVICLLSFQYRVRPSFSNIFG